MGFNNENVINCEKSLKARIGLGIVAIIILLATIAYCAVDSKKKMANEKSFWDVYEDIYNSGVDSSFNVAYVDTNEEIFSFAGTDDNKELFDIVYDQNDYMYVLHLSGKQEKRINDEIAKNGSAHIRGVTSKFSETKARQFLLEQLQEAYPDEGITSENMDDLTGYLQLNVKDNINLLNTMGSMNGWYALVLIVTVMAAGFLIPVNMINLNKAKKLGTDEIRTLEEEMSGEGAAWMPTIKVYATQNYVIGVGNGITPCKYGDVLMLYKQISRYNGIKTHETIKMMKKDGDVVDIAVMAISSLQRTKGGDIDSELEYLGKRIAENNQNVFLGYNAQVYWDLKKRAKAGEFI